jgi:hypothetical protein
VKVLRSNVNMTFRNCSFKELHALVVAGIPVNDRHYSRASAASSTTGRRAAGPSEGIPAR